MANTKKKKRRCTSVRSLFRKEKHMRVELKDREGIFKMVLTKWKEKGKSIIVLVLKWILLTFITGLVENWYEPIYRVLTPLSFFLEEDYNTDNRIVIPVNIEITEWICIFNDHVGYIHEVDEENCQEGIVQSEREVN